MDKADATRAHQIGTAVIAFEQQTKGRVPSYVAVVLSEDTLVITLRGTFSPAELAMAKSPQGADRLRELHRQIFATSSEQLRQEIKRITGVEVREGSTEVERSTGTVVQVFSLAHAVPADTWCGNDPGSAERERALNHWADDGGGLSE